MIQNTDTYIPNIILADRSDSDVNYSQEKSFQ